MEQAKKEYIQKHIDFYSTDEIKARGRQLYLDGKVFYRLYNKETDTYIYSVKGGQNYKVQLSQLANHDLKTSCSCPYIWGPVCKHAVAAMLHLKDSGGFQNTNAVASTPATNVNATRRTNQGYPLDEYIKIDVDFIQKHAGPQLYNRIQHSHSSIKMTLLEVSSVKLVFELDYGHKIESVTFEKMDEQLFVRSTTKPMPLGLNELETVCFIKIANSKTPDLFDLLINEKYKEQSKEQLAKYGLSVDSDFNDYFEFTFHEEKGLVHTYNSKSAGLLPVENVEQWVMKSLIKDLEPFKINLDEELIEPRQERAIGFILDLRAHKSNWDLNSFFEARAIIGKPNKVRTYISSNIEFFTGDTGDFNVEQQATTSQLIQLLEARPEGGSGHDYYEWQTKVIDLLVLEPYVYVQTTEAYKIRRSDLKAIRISSKRLDVLYDVVQNEEFVSLEPVLKFDDKVLGVEAIQQIYKGQYIYEINDAFCVARDFRAAKLLDKHRQSLKMVRSHKVDFLNKVIKPLSSHVEINFTKDVYNIEVIELDFQNKRIYLSERDNHLIITPEVEYHNNVSVPLANNGDVLIENEGQLIQYKRNFELEEGFTDFLASLHPNFMDQKEARRFHLQFNDFVDGMWFYKFYDALILNDVEVFGLKELKKFKYSPHKGKISTSISSGMDWFEIDVTVSFGDNQVKLSDIRKAIKSKQRYIQLSDGSVGILPNDWYHRFERYFRHGEVKDEKLNVSKLGFSIIDELFDNISDTEVLQELVEKRRRIANFTQIEETKVPNEITAQLRPYQKEGLNWLGFLNEMKWGGILADDMGLGKTLQILTFLQHVLATDKTTNLIIVPTSLLFNWENEIKKFAPQLNAHYHYGTRRASDTELFDEFDIVFTSYGVLLRDVKMLSEYQFNYVILDESQAIKNPASRRYKAACLLKGRNRLAMTGTPIENSTFDLFAQMSFVNRGFLGGVTHFKENYSNPIDKDGDDIRASELQKLINPLVLRRTKEKVAQELPDKTEDVIYCEMDPAQRKVYDAFRNFYRDRLMGQIEAEGLAKSKMMVLEALTRLRQICDSPQLINDDKVDTTNSVKIDQIIQHITEKTANHKLLIFSQFVTMLALIKDELQKRGIKFEYLDGQCSTKQREQSVNNFQEDEELRVFLISLKAGGTGLNLTAADYVYIVDPWWNPAVENQAIDRCYRIGQNKKVFAYRMICKNTVEEKILKLQEKKTKIANDIVQTDDSIMKNIGVDDIQDLLS